MGCVWVKDQCESCRHLVVQSVCLCFRLRGVNQSTDGPLKVKDSGRFFIIVMSDQLETHKDEHLKTSLCMLHIAIILGLRIFYLNTSFMKNKIKTVVSFVTMFEKAAAHSQQCFGNSHVREQESRQVSVTLKSL